MFTPEESTHILSLTLHQFAAWRNTHPQAARPLYRQLLRTGNGLSLPTPTRRTDDPFDGTLKFCLPAGTYPSPPPSTPNPLAPQSPLTTYQLPAPATPLESESVIIPMASFHRKNWFTLCLSSQIGCRMACSFCETGRMGLLRNLSPGEIVQQRLVARTLRQQTPHPTPLTPQDPTLTPQDSYFSDGIQNIVFMGMGEPLDNFDNVLQALRVLSDPNGLNFPLAQISVSTVGRIDGLRKLASLIHAEPPFRNLRLAISLNAAHDALRNQLMPINKAMPLADLKQTLLGYPLPPRARFLIEYVLIKDINDSPADARAVAAFCKDLPCVVNLIPYNPQRSATYETPSEETINTFMSLLKSLHIFTKRRTTHGRSLMSACGQLGNPHLRRHPAPV